MTKHTPGPWSVYEDCNKVAAHKAQFPAIGTMGTYYTESITDDRGEFYNPADALLVAAAPDLLYALRFYMAQFGQDLIIKGIPFDASQVQADKIARDAIFKATGENK